MAYEDGMIFLEDTDKQSYFGACLLGDAAVGLGDAMLGRLKAVAGATFPPDTFVQIALSSTPDVDEYADLWAGTKVRSVFSSDAIRDDQRDLLMESVNTQKEFFLSGKEIPHIRQVGMRLHRVTLAISIKIPVSSQPSDKELLTCRDHFDKFEQGMGTAGLRLARADAKLYLHLLRKRFDPYLNEAPWYNEKAELREQILPPGFCIDYSDSKEMVFGSKDKVYTRVFSPRQLPDYMSAALMDYFQGDPSGINNQIPIPWVIVLNLHFPDRIKKNNWLENKFRQLTFQSSQGNIVKWVPRLAQKKADIDILKNDTDSGEAPCEMNLVAMLYSRDRAELNRISAQFTTFLSGYQIQMVEDSQILWPIFWNALPLYPSPTSTTNMGRYWTMSLKQALQFLPITSEWKGTRPGATLLLETRRSQPFAFDFYDSSTNYNALLFAQSGAGKSVFLNYAITNYLSEGARVWVVDIGRSYFKLAKAFNGEFWSFNENSNICLNPFSNVVDIDDEMDLLVSLLSKMAAPTEGLDDYREARVSEAIKAVWSNRGPEMTITDIANWMSLQEDDRVRDIAHMLHPFTMHGQFGIWFDGKNNLNFNSNLIVLELEELEQKPVLQQIVLMILMAKIQHEMYLKMNSGKKLAIFDESWALFADPGVARFLNHAFRRFRKYNGACVVAVQDIADFYMRKDMEAVAANAATKIIMNQLPESVDKAIRSGQLVLDEYGVSQLKTVHTSEDAYSEIMFLSGGGAWSIARLVMPNFLKVLYSTKGDARNLIIEAVEAGVPVRDAINTYIEERTHYA